MESNTNDKIIVWGLIVLMALLVILLFTAVNFAEHIDHASGISFQGSKMVTLE